jgi:hypothetical protein
MSRLTEITAAASDEIARQGGGEIAEQLCSGRIEPVIDQGDRNTGAVA